MAMPREVFPDPGGPVINIPFGGVKFISLNKLPLYRGRHSICMSCGSIFESPPII
jgi:hypothetical protein